MICPHVGRSPLQVGSGIHIRSRARAFVLANPETGLHFAIVSADIGMGSNAVTEQVLVKLDADVRTKGPCYE